MGALLRKALGGADDRQLDCELFGTQTARHGRVPKRSGTPAARVPTGPAYQACGRQSAVN